MALSLGSRLWSVCRADWLLLLQRDTYEEIDMM